jgi:hypothetical protein
MFCGDADSWKTSAAAGLAVSAGTVNPHLPKEQFHRLTRRGGRDLNKWCSINDR